jgi:putative oxidoreductase
MFKNIMDFYRKIATGITYLDFLGPMALRLYLVPVFWMSGMQKWQHMPDTIAWFGNPDWGLGLPYPMIMAYMATGIEIIGALCLLAGLAVRWISIPLIIVMIVAIFTVHLDNGWLAIASQDSEAHIRLQHFLSWLEQNHPNRHQYITELGQPVMLNNGIEFATTYFIMLLSLFFTGAGRFFSIDYWLMRWYSQST